MSIDDKELEDFMPALDLEWTDEAQTRMKNVPFFVRKSVVRGIEQYAKDKSFTVVDDDVVSRARQEREGEATRTIGRRSFRNLDVAKNEEALSLRSFGKEQRDICARDRDGGGECAVHCIPIRGPRFSFSHVGMTSVVDPHVKRTGRTNAIMILSRLVITVLRVRRISPAPYLPSPTTLRNSALPLIAANASLVVARAL